MICIYDMYIYIVYDNRYPRVSGIYRPILWGDGSLNLTNERSLPVAKYAKAKFKADSGEHHRFFFRCSFGHEVFFLTLKNNLDSHWINF